jgi:hypothetical protein
VIDSINIIMEFPPFDPDDDEDTGAALCLLGMVWMCCLTVGVLWVIAKVLGWL